MLTVALCSSLAFAEAPADAGMNAAARAIEGLQLTAELTLVDAGKGPKRVVKFTPAAGTKASYELVTEQDLSLSMAGPDGEVMEVPGVGQMSPTIVFGVSHSVGQPVADGLVPVNVRYDDVSVRDVPPELAQQMAAGLEPMKGLAFRMLIDPAQGRAVQADVSVEDDAIYEMTQALADQFTQNLPTFPAEPIGVGAVWTLDQSIDMSGMQLLAKQKIRVTELTDEHITLTTSFDLAQGDGGLQLPGLPPGASVDMTRFEGNGEGTMSTDLRTMVNTGSMRTVVDIDMTVSAAGQPPMKMGMKTAQTITMKAK
jgi:hypothetical protein